jgi:hypothetical protein
MLKFNIILLITINVLLVSGCTKNNSLEYVHVRQNGISWLWESIAVWENERISILVQTDGPEQTSMYRLGFVHLDPEEPTHRIVKGRASADYPAGEVRGSLNYTTSAGHVHSGHYEVDSTFNSIFGISSFDPLSDYLVASFEVRFIKEYGPSVIPDTVLFERGIIKVKVVE